MKWDLYIEIRHDDAYLLTESMEEEEEVAEESQPQEFLEATPIWIYRQPEYDCTKIEVDYDPSFYNFLHVVFVEYSVVNDDGSTMLRWDISAVENSRRGAKSIAEEIESGKRPGPWDHCNGFIETVEIYSLGIED